MIGIFIEPNYEIYKFINKWKLRIKKRKIKTKFINHPPHSTIYLANLRDHKKIFLSVKMVAQNFKNFSITLNKTGVFVNDKLTGADTIYLNIKKNKNLFLLQKELAKKLKFFIKGDIKKKMKVEFIDKRLNNSQKKFGFPFVGSHWVPHFTIGSIKDYVKTSEYKEFKNLKINFQNKIDKVSIWKISGEKHFKLKEFKFHKKQV